MRIFLPDAKCFGLQGNLLFVLLTGFLISYSLGATTNAQAYREMSSMINSIRKSWNLEILFEEQAAIATAQDHAEALVKRSVLSHFDSDGRRVTERYRLNGGTGVRAGENLGTGHSVRAIFNAWLESESHRENILNPVWGRFGLGISVLPDKRILVVLVLSISRLESVEIIHSNGSAVISVYILINLPDLNTQPFIRLAGQDYKPESVQKIGIRRRLIRFVSTHHVDKKETIGAASLFFYHDGQKLITDLFFHRINEIQLE